MTENPFPFGTVDETDVAVEESEGNKRVLVMAGGVVAALALAAGSFFLLGGDDLEEEVFVPTAAPASTAAVAPTKKVPAKKAAPKLPVAFEDDLGRNPFKPLYVVPVAAPAAPEAGSVTDPTLPTGGTTTVVGTGTTTGSTSGGTTTGSTGTTTGGTATPAPTKPQAPTAQEYTLVLQRVYGAGKDLTAEFTIDGRKVVAQVGGRFGPTSEIRLISLTKSMETGKWTSSLQVGDGEPFDAATGVKVSVR